MFLNINADAVVVHTAKLETMHRSALPVAVRQALNNAAFDVKQNTMPKESDVFVHRSPTFFKATSRVEAAKGFDINTMRAVVGFLPPGGAKESGGATKDLEQQEYGGTIGHRAFIPLAKARTGSSYQRRVKSDLRLAAIQKEIIDSRNSNLHGVKNDKERFLLTAISVGKGGFVIGTGKNAKGNRMLYRINSVHRLKNSSTAKDGKKYESGNTVVNSTAIYSVKSKREVKPKATHFMQKASNKSANKLDNYFIAAAKKQIAKLK